MQIIIVALIILSALIYLGWIAFKVFRKSNDPNASTSCIGCSVNQDCNKKSQD